ncbi:ABATE domain-containing protein [Streptomyces sp. XM4011]|uniref:ABATE domain-containing protein n=1 Tax=Streptomyces sp. XM4011 TaxID=2929780 RepID=UPI001FFAF7C8|nr:ABATE domain-containing protein [Streptomyces sp. XM4011]MCK1814286.1 ABATE domain-containing protein [Streptomyces sp. XM4011]
MEERWPALDLASTIRHDGAGGVADDLATVAGLADWLATAHGLPTRAVRADERLRLRITGLRAAVRALFARAVSPGPPSPADAQRLLPHDEALARLNAAAALEPVTPQLHWPAGGAPAAGALPSAATPEDRLVAALARAAITFLTGPERERLRACTAPRCVRYFVKSHGRQEWCKPSCADRARAARHYRRRVSSPG